jgi:hypothetical protein
VGSDLGSIAAFIVKKGDDFAMHYYLNMVDAEDPVFLRKLEEHKRSGQAINWKDMEPFLSKGTFGSVPDFRPLALVRSQSEVPYLGELL